MIRRLAGLTFTAVLLLAAGWGCSQTARSPFGEGPSGSGTITLEVDNRNFDDATIYAVRFGDRMRAGVVTGKSRESFRVRWLSPAPLRVEVRLLAGGSCTTRQIQAAPGDVIQVDVPIDLSGGSECR